MRLALQLFGLALLCGGSAAAVPPPRQDAASGAVAPHGRTLLARKTGEATWSLLVQEPGAPEPIAVLEDAGVVHHARFVLGGEAVAVVREGEGDGRSVPLEVAVLGLDGAERARLALDLAVAPGAPPVPDTGAYVTDFWPEPPRLGGEVWTEDDGAVFGLALTTEVAGGPDAPSRLLRLGALELEPRPVDLVTLARVLALEERADVRPGERSVGLRRVLLAARDPDESPAPATTGDALPRRLAALPPLERAAVELHLAGDAAVRARLVAGVIAAVADDVLDPVTALVLTRAGRFGLGLDREPTLVGLWIERHVAALARLAEVAPDPLLGGTDVTTLAFQGLPAGARGVVDVLLTPALAPAFTTADFIERVLARGPAWYLPPETFAGERPLLRRETLALVTTHCMLLNGNAAGWDVRLARWITDGLVPGSDDHRRVQRAALDGLMRDDATLADALHDRARSPELGRAFMERLRAREARDAPSVGEERRGRDGERLARYLGARRTRELGDLLRLTGGGPLRVEREELRRLVELEGLGWIEAEVLDRHLLRCAGELPPAHVGYWLSLVRERLDEVGRVAAARRVLQGLAGDPDAGSAALRVLRALDEEGALLPELLAAPHIVRWIAGGGQEVLAWLDPCRVAALAPDVLVVLVGDTAVGNGRRAALATALVADARLPADVRARLLDAALGSEALRLSLPGVVARDPDLAGLLRASLSAEDVPSLQAALAPLAASGSRAGDDGVRAVMMDYVPVLEPSLDDPRVLDPAPRLFLLAVLLRSDPWRRVPTLVGRAEAAVAEHGEAAARVLHYCLAYHASRAEEARFAALAAQPWAADAQEILRWGLERDDRLQAAGAPFTGR